MVVVIHPHVMYVCTCVCINKECMYACMSCRSLSMYVSSCLSNFPALSLTLRRRKTKERDADDDAGPDLWYTSPGNSENLPNLFAAILVINH